MKTTLIIFFDIKGNVHFEFIPPGQTIDQAYCTETLKQLRESVCRKRPELWPNDWILQHDNAPSSQGAVKQFLAQKSITEMEHPPYSSGLLLSDFWLFPKTKSALKGRRFQDAEHIQKNVTTALEAILQQSSKNVPDSGSIVGPSAKLLTGSTRKVTPLSKAASIKGMGHATKPFRELHSHTSYFVVTTLPSIRAVTAQSVQRCATGWTIGGTKVRFSAGSGNSLHHRVQNGSGAHPASYPMGTRGSFPAGKADGARS
jgi:hypothetical protein